MSRRSLFVFSCLLLSAQAFADASTETLLTKMRNAYKSVKTAQFTVKSVVSRGNAKLNTTQAITFASPNKAYAVVKGDGREMTVVCDGKNIKTGGGQQKLQMAYNKGALSALVLGNLETLSFWDYAQQLSTSGNMKGNKLSVSTAKWNNRNWTLLTESAVRQGVIVQYYVDPATHMIWKTVVKNQKGTVIGNHEIQSLKLNPVVDPAKFQIR